MTPEEAKRRPCIGDRVRLCYSTPAGAFIGLEIEEVNRIAAGRSAIILLRGGHRRRFHSWVLIERAGVPAPAARSLMRAR